ncbi:triosephosphate isomerase [Metamycoplasma subdolum]|uniref:Triosephosphate isomerase n=1 Tax=Metamycoplasma subdolum TaxID=92407 RepID=A0A3M0A0T1_9BACT|nr:triose-phosphate isomerase family protein [Metamycoplasma subdolum]RMA78613.1 triosephosphate isomerase [Metamycoplasma subdolum]WPB50785.1 triose-phosphate isomerase family protein [Metamycoplasma subdolum]
MKYLIGNLKMNFSPDEAKNYSQELSNEVQNANLKNVTVGAAFGHDSMYLKSLQNYSFIFGTQNFYPKSKGAFTGEISIRSLENFNLDFCLVGHSERRILFNETEALINKQILCLEKSKIMPILCIGENKEEFENNKTKSKLKRQIKNALADFEWSKDLIISYEPIYAIGNGLVPENSHIESCIKYIKKITENKCPVLYGGSVSLNNIEKLLEIKSLDGFLVGGAALNAKDFVKMAKIMEKNS